MADDMDKEEGKPQRYSGSNSFGLPIFKANMIQFFKLKGTLEENKGLTVLQRCDNNIQARVYPKLGFGADGAMPNDGNGPTLAAVWAALDSILFETATTNKQLLTSMIKKRADNFRNMANPHQELLKFLELQRTKLSNQALLSDDMFQAIYEAGCHPDFAVLISTDGGKEFADHGAWRLGVISRSLIWAQTTAAAKSSAACNAHGNGNGNGNSKPKRTGPFKRNGVHKHKGKGNGKPQADHSKDICVKCNVKGHRPYDKRADGTFICAKKR